MGHQFVTASGENSNKLIFERLVNERYLISKYCNTSYNEIGEITPTERKLIVGFIEDELKRQKEAIDKQKQNKKKSKGRR